MASRLHMLVYWNTQFQNTRSFVRSTPSFEPSKGPILTHHGCQGEQVERDVAITGPSFELIELLAVDEVSPREREHTPAASTRRGTSRIASPKRSSLQRRRSGFDRRKLLQKPLKLRKSCYGRPVQLRHQLHEIGYALDA